MLGAMSDPISPPAVTTPGQPELPAYISNGVMGLRVLDVPLLPGIVTVSGFAGTHPRMQIEAAAEAPYPVAGDIGIDGVWLTTAPHLAEFVEQRYDFGCGELTTRFRYRAAGITADVEVLTFCSRTDPSLVLQETAITVSDECPLTVRAVIDISRPPGQMVRRAVTASSGPRQGADASMQWEALGGRSQVGMAVMADLLGAADPGKRPRDWGDETPPAIEFAFRAHPGQRYRLRQICAVVPSVVHPDPGLEAVRLVTAGAETGFDAIRDANREAWRALWASRILVDADDARWQALADAAFFYLNSSVHRSSPASTSIFGLARWRDYHYYYGHVMWDIETFAMPPLLASQPGAVRAMLEYRMRCLPEAWNLARLRGRAGIEFPWESAPRSGAEATPGVATASWHEDHVTLDVAHAFAQYADATGDALFIRDHTAPVLYGVAQWLTSRVTPTPGGFSLRQTMGIAERHQPGDDDAFTVMLARVVLQEAIRTAQRLGDPVPREWRAMAEGLAPVVDERDGFILPYRGWHASDEKGATPGPLAGLFPLGADADPAVEQATLRRFLDLADGYIGSPMLSGLYGVWASRAGDRGLALELLERGYADMVAGRFLQTLEYLPSRFPEEPRAGPFFANLGAYLISLLYGFPGVDIGPGEPATWAGRPVVLPAGWRRIEVERGWFRLRPSRLVAEQGAERASLTVDEEGPSQDLVG